jgi:hypothetical protein
MSKERSISKGVSTIRPPLLTGTNYYFWKNKMQLFLKIPRSRNVAYNYRWRICAMTISVGGIISTKSKEA